MRGHSRSKNGVASLAYAAHPRQRQVASECCRAAAKRRMDCRVKPGNDALKDASAKILPRSRHML